MFVEEDEFYRAKVPHIAIARVIYAADRRLYAYKIPYVFSSTIAHKDTDRFTPDIVQILKDITLGITPFKGSPCKYAHSERGIGIYLLQVLHEKIPEKSSFVLIQIKTSLFPCTDCKNFWNGNVNFSNTEGMFGGNFACDDGNHISQLDCLQKLKDSCKIKRIAVNINHSFQDEVDTVVSSTPFERLIQ